MADELPRSGRLREVARLVDELVPERVLVHGARPLEGRDLDLLARPAAHAAIAAGLAARGFEWSGGQGARFADGTVDVVDLEPAAHWRLPDSESAALFDEAVPLDGLSRLARAAPAHALLVAARDLAASGRFGDKERAAVERALADDPDAWRAARSRAPAWRATRALALLERAHSAGPPPAGRERLAALLEEERAGRGGLLGAAARARHRLAPRPRRGRVIAISGLDGAGKSTQAALLRDTLDLLGYDAATEWTRLAAEGWLWEIRHRVARLVLFAHRLRPGAAVPEGGIRPGSGLPDAATSLREGSPFLTHAWATAVTLVNASSHLRATVRHVAKGEVVVCDRYVLDSIVHLRVRFGSETDWTWEDRLVLALSPRPLCAFLLDLPADVAHRRKLEDELAWLERLARFYRETHGRLGVKLVDGTAPVETIAAEIAADVWRALRAAR